jgi:outer membrane protein OmpU
MNKITKGVIMNKLTKIGVSALCGSLAAITAVNAGEMTVKGGANATYTKLGYGETGNPLGMASAMTFTGTGELDNGSTVTMNIAHNDKNTYSGSDIAIATPSMGTFTYDEGGGTGIDRYDDMMPTAWEETNGTGVAAGFTTVSGVGGGVDVEWALPADMLPDGVSAYVSISPKADGSTNTDKGSNSAGSDVDGLGWDVAASHTGFADGLTVFGGYSVIPKYKNATAGVGVTGDKTSKVLGATYAVGGATIGYQYSLESLKSAVSGGVSSYENNAYGVSFSVNDDLSLSYGMHKSEKNPNGGASVEVEAQSIQAAYSMGGATLKIAETEVDNAAYVSTTAGDKEGTTIMLSLAF